MLSLCATYSWRASSAGAGDLSIALQRLAAWFRELEQGTGAAIDRARPSGDLAEGVVRGNLCAIERYDGHEIAAA